MKILPVAMLEPLPRRVRPHEPDADTVARYADIYRDETARLSMPPLVVFQERGCERYIVGDGEHRLEGAKRAKLEELPVDLREGDEIDALDFALGRNVDHGLPRTMAGAWHVFCLLMDLPALRSRHRTDQEKADAIGVSRRTVVSYKADYRDCAEWQHMAPAERLKRLKAKRAKERDERREEQERETDAAFGETIGPDDETVPGAEVDEPRDDQEPPKERKARKPREKKPALTESQKRAAKHARDSWKQQQLDAANRKTFLEGIGAIRAIPHDGAEAAKKWADIDVDQVRYVREWCDEFLRAREQAKAAA